ncbi:hypothetical protein GCM10009119_31330 [Algoriphagus jejuensis]|uniref:Aminoglycoside phosphotransferase domain-containing protein n=1 Tax=Algoriphagus jejuensis TaxID=419934 RepID=A0ABP3YHJ1_9BACT
MIDLIEQSKLETLQLLPFWEPEEILIHAEPAGESNMNLVLRIKTNRRSLILKQSKPYVRKYPQIPAPIGRISVEHQFLTRIEHDQLLAAMSPKVILFDPEQHILITEDLGKSLDYTSIYSGKRSLKETEIKSLVDYLNQLHALDATGFPENLDMRRLNHEHIFQFPFLEENGFDLNSIQPGLQEISLTYKTDSHLKEKLAILGDRYLTSGKILLHGDYYPASWLDVPSGIKVIDPEFGFPGEAEFDLGVFLAHLDLGQQEKELAESILSAYQRPYDLQLVQQYRGVETLRRLIGIAQLPVDLTLRQIQSLLETARNLILN